MPSTILEATLRADTGKNANRRLRSQGMIPGVLYGKKIDNKSIAVDPAEVTGILTSDSGQNTIFKMNIGKEKADVLIRDYLLDPLKGTLVHVDFLAVNLADVMMFQVPIHIEGEADGVKNFGGMLDTILREIEVECKASDVPEHISIDVTPLGLNEQIRVGDLDVAEGIRFVTDPERVVVTIAPPTVEEEEEVEEEAALGLEEEDVAEPEVLRKGKSEESEED